MFDVFDENTINSLVKENKTLAQKILDFLNELFDFLTGNSQFREMTQQIADDTEYLDNVRKMFLDALEKNNTDSKNADGESRYAIKYTTDNVPVVVIDENILADVPKSKWVQKVKNTLISKYSGGINIWNGVVKVNAICRNEFVNSKYTKYIKAIDKDLYRDKLLTANNIEEILKNSYNKKIEDLNHARNDSFKQFSHSDVLIKIGNNTYSADVVVGISSKNALVFYDIIDLELTDKKIKTDSTEGSAETATNLFNREPVKNNISRKNNVVNSSISENSENDTRFSYGDEKKGNGYSGYSMSNNAVDAYNSGEKPISKWTKYNILSVISDELGEEKADLLKSVSASLLKDNVLRQNSWHHTGKMYNRTYFYEVDLDKVESLTADDISKWVSTPIEPEIISYKGSIEYLTWEGTRKHPKPVEHLLKDVNIEERGSFYIVTNDNGNEILRKKIGSNGTIVRKKTVSADDDIRLALKEEDGESKSNKIGKALYTDSKNADGESRYALNEKFKKEFDEWDKIDTNKNFLVGTTSDALLSIGMKNQQILMRSGMILKKISKHSGITLDTFRQIPELLENPIVVQFSDAIDQKTNKPKYDSRITVLGELYADMIVDGKTERKPVLVSLELLPTNQSETKILNVSVVTSAYGHSKLQQYLNDNSILYVEPNKKRTNNWLSLNRLQLPLGENQLGSIEKITYSDGKVKIENSKNATSMQIALQKAGIVDSFGNSISENSENDAKDIRYSKNTDSNGNALTEQQDEFFKDSKVRDENGNLIVVYHGSPNNFTVFDRSKIGSVTDYGSYGRGFYFTPEYDYADLYSENDEQKFETRKFYLNIANPYVINTEEDFNKFNEIYLKYAKEIEKTVPKNSNDYDKLFSKSIEKGNEELIKMGYDGVFYNVEDDAKEYITFNSFQSKLTDNLSPSENEDIRYSKKEDFSVQVDNVISNKFDYTNTHIFVCDTPNTLIDVGLKQKPMLATAKHIYSMIVSEEQAKKDGKYSKTSHYHNLGADIVKQLPKALSEPICVIKSNADDNNMDIVIVTELIDKQNNPVIAAIKIDGKGNYNNVEIDSNIIKSAYGRTNFTNYVQRAIDENRVLIFDKKRSQNLTNTPGVQFPDNIGSLDFNNNLSHYKEIVNTYYAQKSENDTLRNSLKDVSPTDDYLLEENKQLKEAVETLKAEMKLSVKHNLNQNRIDLFAKRLLRDTNSIYDSETLKDNLTRIFDYIANDENANYDDVIGAMKDLTRAVIEESTVKDTTLAEEYKPMREYFRKGHFSVSDEVKSELAYR